jgi:hypothetical protein
MKNLVGPNSTCRGGFIQPFVVIGDDMALTKQQLGMMAGVIAPGEAAPVLRRGGLS